MREMSGATRPAASEKLVEMVETCPLARLLAVALIVQAERVREQSTMSPAASASGGPEAARAWALPVQRSICMEPRLTPTPRRSALYPRSPAQPEPKFFSPTPTPALVASKEPNRSDQRTVHASEQVSQG